MAPIQYSERPSSLHTGYPSALQEKEFEGKGQAVELPSAEAEQNTATKMSATRRVFVTYFVCFLVMFSLTTALSPLSVRGHCGGDRQGEAARRPEGLARPADESAFTHLLNAVSPDTLHDLLHRYFPDRYQHGVWPSDRSAMEAVHRDAPALATSLVRMIKRDNTTTTSESSSTTDSQTSTTLTTTSSSDASTSSSSSSSDASSTSTTEKTSSDSQTTFQMQPKPSMQQSSSAVMSTFTTTQDGRPTVVVATAYVAVDPSAPASSTKPSGSLQTNAAGVVTRNGLVDVVAGVVVGGILLL